MPPKKVSNSKAQSATRGRSKSAGRPTPASRGRTPSRSRSRSRSRITPVSKRSRTPASESKARRRRSSSSSSSPERTRSPTTRKRPVAAEKRVRQSTVRATTPTRVSQRIIHKTEAGRSERSNSPSARLETQISRANFVQRITTLVNEKIFPSSVRSLFCVALVLPIFYWVVFLVFTSAPDKAVDVKPVHTLWGPARRFAGVLWPLDWRVYLDYRCHAFVLGYLVLHLLLARFIPLTFPRELGSEARRTGYKANGLFSALVSVGIYLIFQYGKLVQLSGLKPSLLIPKYWLGLMAASGNLAALFALGAFIFSRRLPRSLCSSMGNTGNSIIDFWNGRSLRPRWFGLDWKMVIHRPASIGLFLLELTCLLSQMERYGRASPSLLLLVCLHSIWLADSTVFEHTLLASYEIRHEGFGFRMLTSAFLFPFVYGLTAGYLLSNPEVGVLYAPSGVPVYSNWVTHVLAAIIFLLGYWIYRSSLNQKFRFRTQPNHPEFSSFDKVSGPGTQSLLAGGWWGLIRHPNYFGTLLMAASTSLSSGFASPLPWVFPLFLVLVFLIRSYQTEQFNAEKYGISWTMYTKVVPYKLIPRIY